MKTERIASEYLADALARATRGAGWNFRDEPIRMVILGRCTLYVVPARTWAYRRSEHRAQVRQPDRAQA